MTAELQCDFRNMGTQALVDQVVANATALSSAGASFTAYPCYRDNSTLLVPLVPAYLENFDPPETVYDSGTYIYYTCSRVGANNETYRHLNETAADDNALDYKLGVLCNDGEFVPSTWPAESQVGVLYSR